MPHFHPTSIPALLAIALHLSLLPLSQASAATVSLKMILRDCDPPKRTDTTIVVTPGSAPPPAWAGSLPGSKALSIPINQPYKAPLQPQGDPSTYPARAVVRMDIPHPSGIAGQWTHNCSGILIGPSMVFAAAHCAYNNQIAYLWINTLVVRPGFDHGQDLPGVLPVKVVRIWHPSTFLEWNPITENPAFSDWAIFELEKPIGNDLGWVSVAPLGPEIRGQSLHVLSYPGHSHCMNHRPYPPGCDSVSRSDTLFHSYATLGDSTDIGFLFPLPGWRGESGSALLSCSGTKCAVHGDRIYEQTFAGLDSTASSAIARILESFTSPVSASAPSFREEQRVVVRLLPRFLRIVSPLPGSIEVVDASGKRLFVGARQDRWEVPTHLLGHGLRLIVVHGDGGRVICDKIALP